jgi:putative flippase GtrA
MRRLFTTLLNRLESTKLRFLLVGGSITLFDITFCAILSVILPATLAYCLSFATAVVLRFWIDRNFTFRESDGERLLQFVRYWLSCCLTLIVGAAAFNSLRLLAIPVVVAKVFSVFPVTLLGYLLFRFFVFVRQPSVKPLASNLPP